MKYRKRAIVNAVQWYRHGDVPEVTFVPHGTGITEGQRKKIGWLKTPSGGHAIFPGEWILFHQNGEISSCNDATFKRLYEEVDDTVLIRSRWERDVE